MTTAGIFLLPNGTFFIELIVSIVLILAIYKWVLPPINKAMEDRQEKIRESLDAADKARADAEAADDERRNVLEEARHQAREIVATANRTAEQVRTDAQARGQGEYERIVGNADVEIALARQRAVEEAASRMGEIVMEVVERVIGREVDAEAHRDLIDEAVAALRADTSGGAAAAGSGVPPVNPALQGYTAAVAEAAGPAALGGLAADLEAIEQLVLANDRLRAALTDTAVPGPARRAVVLDLLDGKVTPAARRLAAYAAGVVPAPEVATALGWVSTRVRHLAEGQDDEPGLSLMQSRQRVGGYATAVHEDMTTAELESLEDDLFRFARIVAATPALRSALSDRDLHVTARQGLVTPIAGRQGAGNHPGADPLRRDGGPGPRHRRDPGLPGGAHCAGPGLAHRPRRRGRSDRGHAADRAGRLARHPGRRAGGAAGGGRRVAAERRLDPHRRPAGGRHGTGADRRPA